MFEKEITYENALKAFEKFKNNKIDILKTSDNAYVSTSSVASLDENDMDDGKGWETDIFESIKEENGILIRLFEVCFSDNGFYKDIDYDNTFVFDNGNNLMNKEQIKDLFDENHDYDERYDENEVVFLSIDSRSDGQINMAFPIDYNPFPVVSEEDFACYAGIAIFEDEDGEYEVRYGYEYIEWDNGAVFDGRFLDKYDLKYSLGQFEMILLDKNIVYE